MKSATAIFLCFALFTSLVYAKAYTISYPKGHSYWEEQTSFTSFCLPEMRLMIGTEVGLNYNTLSQDISSSPGADMHMQKLLSGVAPYISVFGDIALTNTIGMQLRLGYDSKDVSNTGSYTAQTATADRLDNTGKNTLIIVDRDISNSLRYYTIAFLWRWNPTKKSVMLFGPVYHISATSIQTTIDRILPKEHDILRGAPSAYSRIKEDMTPFINQALAGIELSMGYTIPFDRKPMLVSKLGFQYFTTSPFKDRCSSSYHSTYSMKNAQLFSIQFGLGLWFSL